MDDSDEDESELKDDNELSDDNELKDETLDSLDSDELELLLSELDDWLESLELSELLEES